MNPQCQAGRIGSLVNFFRAWDDRSTFLWDRCPNPASCRVVSGCVHEHVLAWDACAECAAAAAVQVESKPGRCVRCGTLPPAEKHVCPVLVQVEDLPGEIAAALAAHDPQVTL